MNLSKLNPWNWFKHEESGNQIPVKRSGHGVGSNAFHHDTGLPVQQLHQQIDRLFDEAFRGFSVPGLRSSWLDGNG